ncbi:mycothiol synthase [Cellulomonas endometrii]|uniref:mycothiol synthase n=1 Tax=Cellulomonas endometrii TaxID=3036301 RepID=UPI0024AD71B8|nr:mycothiol synthase [Cellulomonas endometrii]
MVEQQHVNPRTGPLPAGEVAAVRRLAEAAAAHDGVAPLSEQPLLWLSGAGPDVTHLLVPGPGDGLAGYAQVDLRDPALATAEAVVDPAHRRRGTGSALLAAALDAVRARGGDAVSVWAHGDVPPARALAAARGLPVVRELWQMALEPVAVPPLRDLPPGVTVRPFEPGRDEDAWVAVNARAFAEHPEQGRLTRTDLEDRMAEPWFDPAGLLLAERDGRLLGAGWTKVEDPAAGVGEIYALGVDPDAQGQGLGPALTARMLDHLAGRGVRRVVLYTEGDNAPAIRVYRAAGFERSAVDVVYRVA